MSLPTLDYAKARPHPGDPLVALSSVDRDHGITGGGAAATAAGGQQRDGGCRTPRDQPPKDSNRTQEDLGDCKKLKPFPSPGTLRRHTRALVKASLDPRVIAYLPFARSRGSAAGWSPKAKAVRLDACGRKRSSPQRCSPQTLDGCPVLVVLVSNRPHLGTVAITAAVESPLCGGIKRGVPMGLTRQRVPSPCNGTPKPHSPFSKANSTELTARSDGGRPCSAGLVTAPAVAM
jgi:hypothetical protein